MTYPAVLCGADEAAVELFLQDAIEFLDIIPLVEHALGAHTPVVDPAIEQVHEAALWAREAVLKRHQMNRTHESLHFGAGCND